MTDDTKARDGAPFPEPRPERTGFGPMDTDDLRQWLKAKRRWEEEHGPADE
ncbi:hypothetical protein SAMN05660657_03318 [Geodermatophilus amargosae]|uniref:Uncharacterized protein n=1 Tax=Geodermatophilus amargosae TaxID=1296565 RepID=A0A1I7B5Z4_9ACTN|nr:hypothetical protein [Geodermatophilus amargosae]SFT82581.1 hypothetical protein SAMN05660657_03318 [Geodermatophilus amargosae]